MTEFSEFKYAALDFIGRNGMNKQTTSSFSFGKIISLIYADCDLFEQQTTFRSDLLFLFNNLNIFLINSNSFMRVQVRVQKKYFFEFKFKFEFGKMIEFFRVRSPAPKRVGYSAFITFS